MNLTGPITCTLQLSPPSFFRGKKERKYAKKGKYMKKIENNMKII
jgi:hypothetical protein